MITKSGERWTVWLGRAEDALALAATLPAFAEAVTLLLTDPPYGNDYLSGFREPEWSRIEGNSPADRAKVYAVIAQAIRLYKAANQHLYVFGDWDLTQVTGIFKTATLIWDKEQPGAGDLDMAWGAGYEPVQFATGKKTSRTKGEELMRKRRGAVLRCRPVTGTRCRRHPNEKPVPLLRELVEMSSQMGDLVLDPYMGSGSTGVAAILEGRRFAGVEVHEPSFVIACERLAAAELAWKAQAGM